MLDEISPIETEGFVFSRLSKSDSRAIAALEKECFSTPWSAEDFEKAFEQSIFSVFGLSQGGALVAYIAVYHTPDELEILNIATAPSLRRNGIGKRLLFLMLCIGRKLGIKQAFLEVRRTNTPAINLYEQMKFTQIGVRKKYYKDTGEDALVYQCNVTQLSNCQC